MGAEQWAQVLFATLVPLVLVILGVVVRVSYRQGQTAATMDSNTHRLDKLEAKVDVIIQQGRH